MRSHIHTYIVDLRLGKPGNPIHRIMSAEDGAWLSLLFFEGGDKAEMLKLDYFIYYYIVLSLALRSCCQTGN
jgi:hypothetical protein